MVRLETALQGISEAECLINNAVSGAAASCVVCRADAFLVPLCSGHWRHRGGAFDGAGACSAGTGATAHSAVAHRRGDAAAQSSRCPQQRHPETGSARHQGGDAGADGKGRRQCRVGGGACPKDAARSPPPQRPPGCLDHRAGYQRRDPA
jgi:hypothetical protein